MTKLTDVLKVSSVGHPPSALTPPLLQSVRDPPLRSSRTPSASDTLLLLVDLSTVGTATCMEQGMNTHRRQSNRNQSEGSN